MQEILLGNIKVGNGGPGVLLWENDGTNYNGVVTNLDLTNCARILVLFKEASDDNVVFTVECPEVGLRYKVVANPYVAPETTSLLISKTFTLTTTGIVWDDTYVRELSSETNSYDNAYLIPVKIIGYKY